MRKLADAGLAADPSNKQTLFAAFPDLQHLYGPLSAFYSEELG
jgi:hypothetical protein